MTFYDYVSLVAEVEKKQEKQLGKATDGLTVACRPVMEDPDIVERVGRLTCLTKPHKACFFCPHSSFDLLFDTNKEKRIEQVACPRWSKIGGRIGGNSPDGYVSVEMSTCEKMPFEFCPSCPSKKNVETTGADKSVPGWYGRWNRIHKEELEREDDEDG